MKKVFAIILVAVILANSFAFIYAAEDNAQIEKPPGIVSWLKDKGLGPDGIVLVLAMFPIFELRGSLPIALLYYQMPLWKAFLLSVVGNMLPIIPIILLTGPLSRFLSARSKLCHRFFTWMFERSKRKGADLVEKYEALGLAMFVAVPLPATGAWTGAFIAFLLNIRIRRAFPAIFLGVLGAGIIVSLICIFGRETFRFFIN